MKKTLLILLSFTTISLSVNAQSVYWTEGFENPSSTAGASGMTTETAIINSPSGEWKYYYAGSSTSNLCEGSRALRILKTSTAGIVGGHAYAISPHLTNGVTKVSFKEGRGTRVVGVYISTDDGATFTKYTEINTVQCELNTVIFADITGINRIKIANDGISDLEIDELTITSETTLPLDLISFKAEEGKLGNTAVLNWRTTNEVNTKEFIIEKKTESGSFSQIAVLPSKNMEGVHNYTYTDMSTVSGTAYYRLIQVDKDGRQTVYEKNIQSVVFKGALSFSIYPNPAADVLNINHEPVKTQGTIKVLSINGKTMLQNKAVKDSATTALNISALAPGSYILVFETPGQSRQSAAFIKN